MTTLKIGMKIPLLMLLAVFALSACTTTGFQRQNDYKSHECKSLHGRGLISLEDKRKCQLGQAFEFKENQFQDKTKAAKPCCAKMKAADGKEECPCCAGMSDGKGMMCAPKTKDGMKGNIGGMDHSMMNHGASDIYAPAMKTMHKNMNIAPTGDADADFMRGMIPHHQGAIDMAELALAHGKDPQVKKLAQDVIKAQKAEIAFMRDWLSKRAQ